MAEPNIVTVPQGMSHRATAAAQLVLSMLFIGGYFAVLLLVMTGVVHIPSDLRELIGNLLSTLTAGVLLILNYWFARQRESKEPAT